MLHGRTTPSHSTPHEHSSLQYHWAPPSYLWGWQATCTSRAHRQHLLDLLTAALARWRRILHAPVAFQEDVQDWLWDWSSGPFLLPHSARSVSVFGKRQENKQFLRQIWRPLPTRRLKIKLHSPQKRQCVSQRTLTSLKETAQSNRSDSAAFNRSHSQRNWSRPTLSSARHSPLFIIIKCFVSVSPSRHTVQSSGSIQRILLVMWFSLN